MRIYRRYLKAAQNQIDELPGPEARLELLRLAIEELASGYAISELDHFALPTDDLVQSEGR